MSFFQELAGQYIDGEWRTGTGSWDIIDFNPYNGEKLAAITIATAAEVDLAYRAAERAQGEWAEAGPFRRRDVLERAQRVIERLAGEITEAIIDELGGTRAKAEYELALTQEFLREAARQATAAEGRILPSVTDGKENLLHRLPVGVVGVISPFNFPLLVTMKSVAPALALGNAVVVKANQNSPVVGGGLIAKIFEEAGLPAGLLNVVVTDIAEIGDAFIEHPVPQVISFAGSDRVGRHVAATAGGLFKRTILELSGNSALVVLADADIDYAVDAAVFSRFVFQGQVCMAANRILVDRPVAAEFTEKFCARVAALKTGDPREPDTCIGPVINTFHADSLAALVDQAIAEGAEAPVRGRVRGNLVEPTVLTGLPDGSPLLHQEIFGPVALLVPFDGEDEAVRIVNDSPYGLSGAVHTADTGRGVRFARRIRAGMFHVNDSTVHDDPGIAFGGEKDSGLGRMNGDAAVDAFTTQKWISVQHGRSVFPF
ncbi:MULTISPECIES: aldehyde dehydrogenase family protein [unclassified Streptomyces]|uniref:aldehyde dehydrogenase family protein n=1 Tax=unclassified Streptomyces TaxID=2593676 RepID=UPI001043F5EB|nr:aldehyde dehydrogenase family protein [Streptomyces sp. NBC_01423]WSX91733.1 aldehyde dehydrogenase family protein [Streptomyces sp. NBC_00891]WSY06211.1 aldehyde dehydrogenase family protein [Streptomyces sp. NBC_00890]WSZ07835.1 aldehyde dehydrogenase family protein [Streptomyces sp. NBC_00869]WSZ24666.1 aldehyde dehydrogenase family protein [Streptomyces sp. NBC_00870]